MSAVIWANNTIIIVIIIIVILVTAIMTVVTIIGILYLDTYHRPNPIEQDIHMF